MPLCEKTFDRALAAGNSPWLVKFFDESPARQTQTHEMVHIWKHLASTLPTHHCRIGVVDCKKEKTLCNRLKITDRVPIGLRWASADTDPVEYGSSISMELLAEFAVKGETDVRTDL